MKLLLLLLVAYEGKFVDDPRLAKIREALPGQLAQARTRVGEKEPVRVRLEDRGKPGPVARTRRDAEGFVIVLYTEPLLLRAHDPVVTLAHELIHVRQKKRWGALRGVTMPPWVVEGMAVYLSGQLESRARVLAAHVGRERAPDDPTVRLVNGLGGRHTLLDYFEDGAAFAAVEKRHGRAKALAFIEALLAGRSPSAAAARVLGERWQTFEQRSRDYAVRVLKPLIERGRPELLALREKGDPKLPQAGGVYAIDDVYFRAEGLKVCGRRDEALRLLRAHFLDRTLRESTLLAPALRLEAKLLEELGKPVPERKELEAY
ncbi:MAG: hypothetical protein ACYTHK_20580 [Planctomycetota bacterium]